MSLVHSVHPCEAIVNRLANLRNRAAENVRDSKLGLGAGLALAALAGAPMPLPQIALAGPILATLSAGKLGGRAAAAVGFVSYLVLNRPMAAPAVASAVLAVAVGVLVPQALEWLGAVEKADEGASAVVVDCDGFASLDETYGPGASVHAFSLLRRALETETRGTDLVVQTDGQELILVLEGSSPAVAQTVMARVETRFSQWLADAGYDCNLSVGLANADLGGALDETRATRPTNGPYLD